MKYFTPSWLENGCSPIPEYEENFGIIRDKLPKTIDEYFSLHDARIVRIQYSEKGYKRNDVAIFLDTTHSYTKAKKIVFIDAEVELVGIIENTWWIAEEFYVIQEGYRIEAMTVNGETGKYSFLTIKFKDILIK